MIVGGDFNCDVLEKVGYESLEFTVPKYDPTIHRVICSGGSGDKCVDFFAYKNNRDVPVMATVSSVRADIVWPNGACDPLSWDKGNFVEYTQHLHNKAKSTLDRITKEISDHDPLKAGLTIEDRSSSFHITYIDMNYKSHDEIINYSAGLQKSDICISQNGIGTSTSIVAALCSGFKVINREITGHNTIGVCLIAYNATKFNINIQTEQNNKIVYTFQCITLANNPSFTLVVFSNQNTIQKNQLMEARKTFEVHKVVPDTSPVLLAGEFNTDLFQCSPQEQQHEYHGFIVPQYAPTMYRMIHPYADKPLHICRDFFAYKNYTGEENIEITIISVDDVHAATIPPSQDLIIRRYPNVNYALIKDDKKIIC